MGTGRLSEAEKEQMVLRYRLGENRKRIATDYGVSDDYPRILSQRKGGFNQKRPPPNLVWVGERLSRLKAFLADGLSASQIAAQFGGMTRNAVIGAVHRLGLSKTKSSKPRAASKPRYLRNGHTLRKSFPKLNPEPFMPRNVEILPLNIALAQLTNSTCRFPYGDDPATMTYCGREPFGTLPYCAEHCAITYTGAALRAPSTFRFPKGRAA